MLLIITGTTGQTVSEYSVALTYSAIFTLFSFAHHINPKESMYLIIFKDNLTLSRAIFQNSRTIPGQMGHFSNSRSIPGPKSNSRSFQGLCEPCVTCILQLIRFICLILGKFHIDSIRHKPIMTSASKFKMVYLFLYVICDDFLEKFKLANSPK